MANKKSLVCCRLFTPLIFNLFFSILLIPCSSICQEDDSLYYTNPDYHVAKELFKRRIVMVGDFDHGQPGAYHHLLNTLDNWFNIAISKKKTFNLTLIIEYDEESAEQIDAYTKTGDLEPLLDKYAPDLFIENLEYFCELRNFSQKVDSINRTNKNKITFEIRGFDEFGLGNFESIAMKTQRESELYLINERDSITAVGVINYMKTSPNNKILIFYGLGHLVDGYFNKNLGFGFKDLTQEESMGFFLVHYLKKEFGKDNVRTVVPRYYVEKIFNDPVFSDVKKKDFLSKSEHLRDIRESNMQDKIDYVVYYHSKHVPLIYTKYICSKYVFEKTIEGIKRIKNCLPGFIAIRSYNSYLNAVFHLTGIEFANDVELDDWTTANNYNGIDWLYSNKLSDSLLSYLNKNPRKDYIFNLLSGYGVDYTINDSVLQLFDEWKQQEFPSILNKIKFTNSIGIYWFGYPDEKIKAKEYLKEFSGEDFQEPEKYLQWYRMKYYGFEY